MSTLDNFFLKVMDTLGITMDDNSSEIQPSFVRKTFTWIISHISKTYQN